MCNLPNSSPITALEQNLREMERTREKYWRSYPQSSPYKLRWRALTVRHSFHVLPGESILEIGAGGGIWSRELAAVFKSENEITAAIFNADLAESKDWRAIPSVRRRLVKSLDELPEESFDYVVGTAILCHDRFKENLRALYRLLKPGGQILFFEQNLRNPQVLVKSVFPAIGRWSGNARCQIGIRKTDFRNSASQQGFRDVEAVPYDIIHPLLPKRALSAVQSVAFAFEHAPILRDLCGTFYLWARKPGGAPVRRAVNLARHNQFHKAVSFVVPCHNEETTIGPLVTALTNHFSDYIHEIVIVNDNSKDRTAEVADAIARQNGRVRVINRKPPNGVGRALRDGYAAATGAYIFTLDSDFVQIVPEMRDLFDAVAEGYDGAIGSRFTQESIMVNYPFTKIVSNRLFHFLARRSLRLGFHDISNNLKLYKAEILKNLEITENHFAANAEIGLKTIAAGYRIKEVPVSWINRTGDMGSSSFRLFDVGPHYVRALRDVMRWMRHLKPGATKKNGRGAGR
ncbi:MAG TPA: bifunctional class I SAM-dependent methyltransferase/glycosyltransferase family 2 protein [Terriglobia bacterium]